MFVWICALTTANFLGCKNLLLYNSATASPCEFLETVEIEQRRSGGLSREVVPSDVPVADPSKAQISQVLRAVASFAYPEMFQLIKAQCLPISNCLKCVDQYSRVDEIIVGLEFHHDKSEIVDISFFGNEWSKKIQKNIMPEWWAEIEKICLESSGHSGDFGGSLFSSNDSSSGRLTTHATSVLQLRGDHIIECEARNGQISVAGIFSPLSHEIHEDAQPVFSSVFDVVLGSSGSG